MMTVRMPRFRIQYQITGGGGPWTTIEGEVYEASHGVQALMQFNNKHFKEMGEFKGLSLRAVPTGATV